MGKVVLRTAAVAAVLCSIGTAPASAQDFGGGTLPSVKAPRAFSPIMGITLQQRGNRMAFRFETTLKCGGEQRAEIGRKEVPLAGGRFRAKSASIHRINGANDRVVYSWRLRGRSNGTTVTGRLRITGVFFLGGRRIPCTAKPVRRFKAQLTAPAAPGGPKPPRRSAFGGTSDLVVTGLRSPVLLRVSGDAKRVRAIWGMRTRCATGPGQAFLNISPAARLKADGTFSRPEKFSIRYRDVLIRYKAAISGRFSGSGASGTLQLTSRVFTRNGKRLKTTCDSGVHAWSTAQIR